MDCPSCGKPFESLDIGGLPLDRCEPCRTYWFDRRELEAFLKIVPPLKQKRGTGSLKLPTPATCPRCETPTLEHGSWHSVPMARCATCRGLLIGYDGIREISTKMGKGSQRERDFHWPEDYLVAGNPEQSLRHVADRILTVDRG